MGSGTDLDRVDKGLPSKVTSKERIEANLAFIQERVESGATLKELAEELGVNPVTLRGFLWLDGSTANARAVYFINELAERYRDLLEAQNGLEMSKAREALNHMRLMAKSRCREYFGDEPAIAINITTPEQASIRIKQLEEELGIVSGSE